MSEQDANMIRKAPDKSMDNTKREVVANANGSANGVRNLHSLDRIILAYAVKSKQSAVELSNSITFEYLGIDFQWLYKFIMDYFNDPKFKELPTAIIIEEYLTNNYSQESFRIEGIRLFNDIASLEINMAEFKWYLEKLKVRYNEQVQNSCISNASKIIQNGGNDPQKVEKVNKIIQNSVVTIDSIYKTKAYKEGSLDQSARARLQYYKEVEANPEIARGVLSGFSELDRITNGLHPGELLMIGGATGSGKSVVMMNMAINAYLGKQDPFELPPSELVRGHNVLYFTLEMPKESLERRIDACLAQILYNEIRDGRLSKEDKEKYGKVLRFQSKYEKKFYVVDVPRGITVRELEVKYLEIKDALGINFDVVVVDYIGIMKASVEQTSDWLSLGHITEELHEFARVYKIAVITATQLNRSKNPNEQQHSTDRVARSDMIPQNCNIILQIDSRGEDEHVRCDMQVFIIKMRDGERGSFTLVKDFSRMRVVDMTDESFVVKKC